MRSDTKVDSVGSSDGSVDRINSISMVGVTDVTSSVEARQLYVKLGREGKLNELDVVRLIKTVITFHELNGN